MGSSTIYDNPQGFPNYISAFSQAFIVYFYTARSCVHPIFTCNVLVSLSHQYQNPDSITYPSAKGTNIRVKPVLLG